MRRVRAGGPGDDRVGQGHVDSAPRGVGRDVVGPVDRHRLTANGVRREALAGPEVHERQRVGSAVCHQVHPRWRDGDLGTLIGIRCALVGVVAVLHRRIERSAPGARDERQAECRGGARALRHGATVKVLVPWRAEHWHRPRAFRSSPTWRPRSQAVPDQSRSSSRRRFRRSRRLRGRHRRRRGRVRIGCRCRRRRRAGPSRREGAAETGGRA